MQLFELMNEMLSAEMASKNDQGSKTPVKNGGRQIRPEIDFKRKKMASKCANSRSTRSCIGRGGVK